MTISTGVSKQLIYKKESSWGTAPGASGAQVVRRRDSDLNLTKQTYRSNELRADMQRVDFRHGSRAVEGSINGEFSVGTWIDFIASALRQPFQVAATTGALIIVTSAVTTGSEGTFTRSAGSYFTDGFKIGDVIRWTGWASPATTNNTKNMLIIALTATVMTVTTLDGSAIVARAAGDSVTGTVTGKKTWVPTTGHTNDSYSIEQWFSDSAQSELFTGCKISQVDMNLPATGIAEFNTTFMGKNVITATAAYFTTPNAATTGTALAPVNGILYVSGVKVANITGINLTLNANMTSGEVIGSNTMPDIFHGSVDVSGQITAYFEDATMRDMFLNETEATISVVMTADNAAAAGFVGIMLPRVKMGGSSKDDGEKGLIQTLPFTALLKTTGGTGTAYDQTSISIQDSAAPSAVYDDIESEMAAVISFDRTLGSYAGPLFRLERKSDNVQQDFNSVDDVDGFLSGGRGAVVAMYDQLSGAQWSITGSGADAEIKKFGGKYGASNSNKVFHMPTDALPQFNGVDGISVACIWGDTGMRSNAATQTKYASISTGASTTLNRADIGDTTAIATATYRVAGRRIDGTSATEVNSTATWVDTHVALAVFNYAGGPLQVYADGNATPIIEQLTHYGAGPCSATDPLASAAQAQRAASLHEIVFFKTALTGAGERDVILNRHATFFSDRKSIADGGYTGYSHPLMVEDGARVFVSSCTYGGYQRVHEIDTTTKKVIKAATLGLVYPTTDDHKPGSILKTPGGGLLHVFAGHNDASTIVWRRSATATLDALAANTSTSKTGLSGTASYIQTFIDGTDVYILTRLQSGSPVNRWELFKSTDDGITFGSGLHIVDNSDQFYVTAIVISAGTVLLRGNTNSDNASNVIRMAKLNLATGDISSGAGVIGNTTTSSAYSDWTAIVTPAGGRYLSGFTSSADGSAFIYADHTSTYMDGTYKYAKLTGADHLTPAHWTISDIATHGDSVASLAILRGDISNESGLTNPRVWIGRNTGTQFEIQRWDASNVNGTAWTYTSTLDTQTIGNNQTVLRPYSCKGSTGAIPVMWMSGYYVEYFDFQTKIKWPLS